MRGEKKRGKMAVLNENIAGMETKKAPSFARQ